MFATFISTVEQVAILSAILLIGIIAGKYNVITEEGEKQYAELLISVVVPLYLLSSFNLEFDKTLVKGFLIVLVSAFVIMLIIWLLCDKLIQNEEVPKKAVIFSMMFRNYGCYCMPLAQAMYGTEGLFYCCAIVVAFNILVFTVGIYLMGNDTTFSIKKMLLRPSIIAIFIGLLLFFFNIRLPNILDTVIKKVGQCNAPLGLIMVGARLSRISIRELFNLRKTAIYDAVNLIVVPVAVAAILSMFNIDHTVAMVIILWLCAPTANYTSVFSIRYGHDQNFCAKLVSEQSLFCMLTIPITATIAEMILKL